MVAWKSYQRDRNIRRLKSAIRPPKEQRHLSIDESPLYTTLEIMVDSHPFENFTVASVNIKEVTLSPGGDAHRNAGYVIAAIPKRSRYKRNEALKISRKELRLAPLFAATSLVHIDSLFTSWRSQ